MCRILFLGNPTFFLFSFFFFLQFSQVNIDLFASCFPSLSSTLSRRELLLPKTVLEPPHPPTPTPPRAPEANHCSGVGKTKRSANVRLKNYTTVELDSMLKQPFSVCWESGLRRRYITHMENIIRCAMLASEHCAWFFVCLFVCFCSNHTWELWPQISKSIAIKLSRTL